MSDRMDILWMVATLCVALLCGCGDAHSPSGSTTAPMPRPALDDFPRTNRMLLGEFQAQVKPLMSIPVSAPADGDARFHVDQPRLMLEEGALWAEVAPEQIAGEERAIELNTRDESLRLRQELQRANRELERVRFMLADPVLRDIPYGDRIMVNSNLVERLEEEIDLLRRRIATCGEEERLAFEQSVLRSRLVMPFDGELLVYLPVSEARSRFRVAANTPIGLMRDVSEIFLCIIVRDPRIASIPPDRLHVELRRDHGAILSCAFHDTQLAESGALDVLVYRFALPADHAGELTRLIGANLTSDLWVVMDREFHVVPKLDVALALEGGDAYADWGEAVEALWPSSRLLLTGRARLGVMSEEGMAP